MRVAFIVHAFPVVSETFILRQVTGLLDLGHDIHIFSQRRPDSQIDEPIHREFLSYNLAARTTYLDEEMPAASGYWSMPAWPPNGETWLPGAELPVKNSERIMQAAPVLRRCFDAAPEITLSALDPDEYGAQATSLEALYHVASFLGRKGEFDVVHAHFGPIANSFRFVRFLWNVPFIVTFYGYDFSSVPFDSGEHIYRRLFADADAVVAISEHSRRRLETLGCPPEKLAIVRLGVCPTDFEYLPRQLNDGDPVRLLTVGRLVEKKGLEYSLLAVARARQKHPNLRYEIIGEGPLRPALQVLITNLDLDSAVTLWGATENAFVRQKMADAHLFILSSVTAHDGDQEGTPVALMEAQASGLPVLSTKHSGIPEFVSHGESGFLVPERDAEALASRLTYLIEHSESWPRMGREGRKIVENRFNIDVLNRDLIHIYEQARLEFGSRNQRGNR